MDAAICFCLNINVNRIQIPPPGQGISETGTGKTMALTLFLLGDDRIDSRHVCRGAQQARVSSIWLGPQRHNLASLDPFLCLLCFQGTQRVTLGLCFFLCKCPGLRCILGSHFSSHTLLCTFLSISIIRRWLPTLVFSISHGSLSRWTWPTLFYVWDQVR